MLYHADIRGKKDCVDVRLSSNILGTFLVRTAASQQRNLLRLALSCASLFVFSPAARPHRSLSYTLLPLPLVPLEEMTVTARAIRIRVTTTVIIVIIIMIITMSRRTMMIIIPNGSKREEIFRFLPAFTGL
jgi:hypothetical protein